MASTAEPWEYDCPRFYDFEDMSDGAEAEQWFDTAPDGPGTGGKAAAKARHRLVDDKENADTEQAAQQQTPDKAQQKPGKAQGNIVTSWAGTSGEHGIKRTFPSAAAEQPGSTTQQRSTRKVQRISLQQEAPRSEPRVTRSMSRLKGGMSPVPERPAAAADMKRRCMSVPRQRLGAAGKLHHVLQPKLTQPPRSTKPLTLPEDLQLRTSSRLRSGARQQAPQQQQEQEPAAGPQPSPFKSLAEKVRDFQSKTPARFKTRPSKVHSTGPPPLTEPKEPLLRTAVRERGYRAKGRQEELEQEDLTELQKKFHARPVDRSILSSSGQLGVPRVDKKPLTQPRPFTLRSDTRASVRRSHGGAAEAASSAERPFKAQPLKRSILDGPDFKPVKDTLHLTMPKSPFLRTKRRHHEMAPEEPKVEFHARPVPDFSKVTRGRGAPTRELTQPAPFDLATEKRGQQHQQQLSARLKEEEEAAARARRVQAQPLPCSTDAPVVAHRPEPKPLTMPKPFDMKSEALHHGFLERRQRELEEEEAARKAAAEFKARPMWAGRPYQPAPSDHPLTQPEDPGLETEARATERAAFDAAVQEKLQKAEEEKRRQEQLQKEEEERAAKEFRKGIKFQARPMPKFDQPFFAMPSEKPLTQAKTPNFASRRLKRTKS